MKIKFNCLYSKPLTILVFQIIGLLSSFAENDSDSLVLFSELKFHSGFEKEAFRNFVLNKEDTFNLFLAIDENITPERAKQFRLKYESVFADFQERNISGKKMNKKIKLTYSITHERFLSKYNMDEYFPFIFQNGSYNCVTASILYALIFEKLNIPYKIQASINHVYLVANPGEKSVVVETTNPVFEKTIFTGEYKQQYAYYLRNSKMISEEEFKSKSAEEIFEEQYYQVKETDFKSLAGFQYYNKALSKLIEGEYQQAYELCQKAIFFYPSDQTKTLLITSLLAIIDNFNFNKFDDIDYIAQLSRFENITTDNITSIVYEILKYNLQFIDRIDYCDSLMSRLIPNLRDVEMQDEVNFLYNLLMSYELQQSDKIDPYIEKAISIKSNHRDAIQLFTFNLQRKLAYLDNPLVLLDSVLTMQNRYSYDFILPVLKDYELTSYLRIALDAYKRNKFKIGDSYLKKFEQNCGTPVENKALCREIESTYRSIAVYCIYKNYQTTARKIVERGLKYVPDSRYLKSAMY